MHQFVRKFYYLLRPYIPLRYRWKLQEIVADNKNGFYTQPMWPIPETPKYDDDFQKHYHLKSIPLPFVLTHDVDTRQGFENILEVAEVESKLGFRSSWNIVPNLYKIDFEILEKLKEMGMEVGVHDWNHDGKLFSKREVFLERVELINDIISKWDAKGFRAGMAFHHDEWTQEIRCQYDSSYYDTDPYQPLGGGCSYITPYRLERIVEIPYNMPQDHVIFVAKAKVRLPKEMKIQGGDRETVISWIKEFGNRNKMVCEKSENDETVICGIDIWKMKLEWLIEKRGVIVMITHPDYLCNRDLVVKPSLGYFSNKDDFILSVREKGIVGCAWQNSLLEQYAAFLIWAKNNFNREIENYLAVELYDKFVTLNKI